jgi:EAL domain-containing protein (putative c-di-GMP-specific phosphodiesterase class I)
VIDEACASCMSGARGLGTCMRSTSAPTTCAIRISSAILQALLAQHRVPAELIELEVTEGTLLEDPEMALRCLQAIRDLGVICRSTTSAPATPRWPTSSACRCRC